MTNRKKHNLILDVENFGPIAEAKNVEIKPMTVFVGPSNTGKSYLAILLHSMLQAKRGDIFGRRIETPSGRFRDDKQGHQAFQTLWSEIQPLALRHYLTNDELEETDNHLWDKLSDASKNTIQTYASSWLQSLSALSESSICAFFETESIDDLRTGADLPSDNLIIGLKDTSSEWELKIKNEGIRFDINDLELLLDEVPMLINHLDDNEDDNEDYYGKLIMSRSLDSSISRHLSSLSNSMYFPAARTGIMTGHRVLTDSIIENVSEFAIDRREIVQYHRISRDFLRYLINITGSERYFVRRRGTNLRDRDVASRIAKMLEETLIDGSIEISKPEFGPSEVQYSHDGVKLPMFRSSSMVTELAPIILFLRRYVRRDDLLIIEEPEAHLHPEAQQKMAAALAFMVRKGLRVLITTHSHYMVEQMSTFVNASYADPEERASKLRLLGPDVDKDVYLNEDDIAVYDFAPQAVTGGTVVREVVFDTGEYIFAPENHSKAVSDQFNRNSRMLSTRINKE